MKKIGFSGQCPNGDISALNDQIILAKESNIQSLEIPLYETDVICGKKIMLKKIIENFCERNRNYEGRVR